MVEGISSLRTTSADAAGPPRALRGQRQGTALTGASQVSNGRTAAARAPAAGSVEQMAEQLNQALNQIDGKFSVSVDDATGMVVVRITDSNTGEIVKQIPPQQVLDANVSVEKIIGLLVNDQA